MSICSSRRAGRLKRVRAQTGKVVGRRSTPSPILPVLIALTLGGLADPLAVRAAPTQSTTIALSSNGTRLVNINRETNSVAIFRVSGGGDVLEKQAEVPVGREPSCVAVRRSREAYVTNSASGTVSVISLSGRDENTVVAEIPVGAEPRGCALTPQGRFLHVANHTAGTVSIIDTQSRTVVDTVQVGGNPTAIAIDDNERVFVTQFFAELIPDGPGEGFDDGKQGIVHVYPADNPAQLTSIPLSPLADVGFTADRSAFCPQFNPNLHDAIFCPDVNEPDPTSNVIANDPQGAFPNQLKSAVIRGRHLYLPNIGAGPEPPIRFNVNVQALVHVVDTVTQMERQDLHVNLNAQIAQETQPANPTASLDRLFGNDLAAIDCDLDGTFCLIVSRGGNYALRATIAADGSLDIGAPSSVVRFQTGNIPTGVVIDRKGQRAYVNNEVGISVSILDLETNTVIARDVPSGTPPEPGSFDHRRLVGKLVFFTALGTPDNGLAGLPIRAIEPLQFRGKASDNAWSSCASCHDNGLDDGVPWFFPTGIRRTIRLDAFYGPNSAHDSRISNWSALRGSPTHDFTFNSRNIQGGTGFAGDPPNPNILPNHGITQGGSEALDFETVWVETIRTFNMPAGSPAAVDAGRAVFGDNCASCHGGAKWTKSQIFHIDNPAIPAPNVFDFFDPGVTNAGPQIVEYERGGKTIQFLDDVGTFDPNNPLEIRGTGGAIGQTSFGVLGFNTPTMLGVGYHGPYFHDASAQSLEEVFDKHQLNGGTIAGTLGSQDLANLTAFLNTIDARTAPLRSDGDDFRDPFPVGP